MRDDTDRQFGTRTSGGHGLNAGSDDHKDEPRNDLADTEQSDSSNEASAGWARWLIVSKPPLERRAHDTAPSRRRPSLPANRGLWSEDVEEAVHKPRQRRDNE